MRPPKASIISCLVAVCAGLVFAHVASGQTPDPAPASGAAVFERECASCHASASANAPVPGPDVLRQLAPDAIVTALTSGRMRVQGDRLTEAERRAVAQFLTGRSLPASASSPTSDRCSSTLTMSAVLQGPAWNGWGAGLSSTRYQQAAPASLAAADVPKLKLKWSFGFAGALA